MTVSVAVAMKEMSSLPQLSDKFPCLVGCSLVLKEKDSDVMGGNLALELGHVMEETMKL